MIQDNDVVVDDPRQGDVQGIPNNIERSSQSMVQQDTPRNYCKFWNNLARVLLVISLGGKDTRSQPVIFSTFNNQKENH